MTKKKKDGHSWADAITQYYKRNPEAPRRTRRLARLMSVRSSDYGRFRAAFKRLRDAGKLAPKPKDQPTAVGRFEAKEKGFGFVRPEKGEELEADAYVSAAATRGAMSGDLVVVRITHRRGEGDQLKIEGEITKVLERHHHHAVGTLSKESDAWILEPDGRELHTPIVVDTLPPGEVRSGTKVVVEIIEFPQGAGMMPVGTVTEILGEAGELATETEATIRAHSLPHRFSPEAEAEARRIVDQFDPAELEGRLDLTDRTVITIDPEDARDFDDALSLEPGPEGEQILGVHIADVSHFVEEGSPLDLEAQERGTSVYFPRRVIHMLPPALSQGVCALKQDQLRPAMSVFITYGAGGEVRRRQVARSVIRSTRRLTYEQAQRVCDGDHEGVDVGVAQLIEQLDELAHTVRDRRIRRGMLSLDLPEISLELDDSGQVVDAKPTDHTFSHTLIEMFMVEANEAVATLLGRAEVPAIRRIHPKPKASAWAQLVHFAGVFGHRLPQGAPSRKALQKLVDAVSERPEGYALNLSMLRSFQQAHYSIEEEGHFALASDAYCHFTSPIRRYPDLLVHRMIERHLLGGLPPPTSDEDLEELADLADHCSETERRAEAAERELKEVMVLQHLSRRVGETFEGVVTGVTSFGLFVQSPRFLVEGLIPRDALGGGWWTHSPETERLVDDQTGTAFRLGDLLEVTIEQIDLAERHLNLSLNAPVEKPKRSKSNHESKPKHRRRRRDDNA